MRSSHNSRLTTKGLGCTLACSVEHSLYNPRKARKMGHPRWFRASAWAAIALTLSLTATAQGDLAAIEKKLHERITLATLDANGEIATAGSVVTLQKSSLQMCATNSPPDTGAPANTYKNGKLSAGMFIWRLGLGIAKIDPNTIAMRTYVAGEKFWVVHINVKKNGIEFKLWTDADSNGIRYWSWLEIPFEKKQIPSADEVMKTVAEVLAVEPADNQGAQGSQPAPAPAPAPAPTPAPAPPPMPEIAPPPPPTDVPPPTIGLGQTKVQVTAAFGQPLKVAKLGVKDIFYYKDMKVTFTNGKVSNVE